MNELKKQLDSVRALLAKYGMPLANVKEIEIGIRNATIGDDFVVTCCISLRPVKEKAPYIFATGDTFKTALARFEVDLATKSDDPF